MSRGLFAYALCVALGLAGCATDSVRPAFSSYPLLDGNCAEYEQLGASAQELPENVTLYAFQDNSFVWLCAALPEDSYGTLDLAIDAPGLPEPLNLHVSAQVGEWPLSDPDAAPQTSDSDRWWRVSGWFGIAVRMNGYTGEGENRRARFIPSEGRELQLSKERFGRGVWRLRFEFRAVKNSDGDNVAVLFPSLENEHFILEAK